MYIKPLERLGGARDGDIDVLTSLERAAAMKARLRDNGVLETAAEPLVCYAAMANSLIVRSDGRIGKCTVAMNDSRNTIGQLNGDGSLSVDNEKFRPWVRGLVSGEPLALACPLHGL